MVNVSIRPKGEDKLYTRCEIKNMNSFKFIEKAIKYEVNRQIDAWEDGIWWRSLSRKRLYTQIKMKQDQWEVKRPADYRYFRSRLIPVKLTDEMMEEYTKIPELPDEKKEDL